MYLGIDKRETTAICYLNIELASEDAVRVVVVCWFVFVCVCVCWCVWVFCTCGCGRDSTRVSVCLCRGVVVRALVRYTLMLIPSDLWPRGLLLMPPACLSRLAVGLTYAKVLDLLALREPKDAPRMAEERGAVQGGGGAGGGGGAKGGGGGTKAATGAGDSIGGTLVRGLCARVCACVRVYVSVYICVCV
jgi:hypothetical protein